MSLIACSSLPTQQGQQISERLWQQHLQALQAFDRWRVDARIAVKTAHDGGHARMVWRQHSADFTVRFSVALGQGSLQLQQDQHGAELISRSGRSFRGESAESLLYRETGWQVPVQQLRQWLIGHPGETQNYTYNQRGLLTDAHFNGWSISIDQYNNDSRLNLPQKITLARGDIKIRVVVNSWHHTGQKLNSRRVLIPSIDNQTDQ